MSLAYDMYRGESISYSQLRKHRLTSGNVEDIVVAMENQLGALGLTMDAFNALNQKTNSIALSAHSWIRDFNVLRQKLTELDISEAGRSELMQLLALAEN
jgi:hypothetical protein